MAKVFNSKTLDKFMPTIISPISSHHHPNEPIMDIDMKRAMQTELNLKGLNKSPCRLTMRDIHKQNNPNTTMKKIHQFEEYLETRLAVEEKWKTRWEEQRKKTNRWWE